MKIAAIFLLVACIASSAYACTLGTLTGCDSTGPLAGITSQIVSELNAMGYSFRGLNPQWVHCPGWACVLQSSAASALESAAQSRNDYITLSSAFRSSAEQYVLYRWYLNGHQCGISLAAAPGQSNHEGGRAIDTPYYNYWLSTLQSHGFSHTYPSTDPVHFDYLAAPNICSQNLLAFQRVWNAHNANKLSEDGIYGPNTANALYNTPCGGW
jgi:hypothetical protein